jgi:hypothetical protein
VLVVALAAFLGAPSRADDRAWCALPVTDGVAAVTRSAGLVSSLPRWRAMYEAARRRHGTYGEDTAVARWAEVLSGTPAPEAPASVPLPLAPAFWSRLLGSRAVEGGLAPAILADRRAALLYRGLAAMDEETLLALARDPGALEAIYRHHADVLALFGGSFRVRDGALDLPGGAEAAALWEEVARESPRRPARFLAALLGAKGGRRALLYDALARLDERGRRFALGLGLPDARERDSRFRALTEAVDAERAWWRLEGGAFSRPDVDAARLLREVRVTDEGALAPPASRAFWEAVFDGQGLADPRALWLARVRSAPAADAAWLVERIATGSPVDRGRRFEQLTFGQRVFAGAPEDLLADVLASVRALPRRRALLLALERMGSRDPALFAAAVGAADRLQEISDQARRARSLAQLQGALAVLERSRFSRALDPVTAEGLARSLFDVSVAPFDAYDGRLALWLDRTLTPALARVVYGHLPPGDADAVVLRAMAGAPVEGGSRSAPFEWEGMWYRADPGQAELARLERVRARQGGPTLAAVLGLCRGAVAVRGEGGMTADEDVLGPLEESARLLSPVRDAGDGTTIDAVSLVSEATRRIRREGRLAAGEARRLVEACDSLTGAALVSLAYAAHLGDPAGAALAGEDVARRHQFGSDPWALPEERAGPGLPWHVDGSLLGLDVALAGLSLHRLRGDELPDRPPVLDAHDRRALAPQVSLLNPRDLTDEGRDAIAVAIQSGRLKVERLVGNGGDLETIARRAGLEAWRTQALRWLLEHDPSSLEGFFSLAELFHLGWTGGGGPEGWGTVDVLVAGLAPRIPPARPVDDTQGRNPPELLTAGFSDLLLRVAVHLAERRVPASVAPALMAGLMTDLLAEARPVAPDDRLGLEAWVRELERERLDDAVAALAGNGPLRPAPSPGQRR